MFIYKYTNRYRNTHISILHSLYNYANIYALHLPTCTDTEMHASLYHLQKEIKAEQLMLFLLIYYLLLSSMNKSVTLQFFLCQFICSHTVVLSVFVLYIHHKNMLKHHWEDTNQTAMKTQSILKKDWVKKPRDMFPVLNSRQWQVWQLRYNCYWLSYKQQLSTEVSEGKEW